MVAGSTPLTSALRAVDQREVAADARGELDAVGLRGRLAGADGHRVPAALRGDHVRGRDLLADGLLVGDEQRPTEDGDERHQRQADHRAPPRWPPCGPGCAARSGAPGRLRLRRGGRTAARRRLRAAARAEGPAWPSRRTARARRSRGGRSARPARSRRRASRRRARRRLLRRWRLQRPSCAATAGPGHGRALAHGRDRGHAGGADRPGRRSRPA